MGSVKYVLIVLAVIMSMSNLSPALAQSSGPAGTPAGNVTGVGPQPQQAKPSYGVGSATSGQNQTAPVSPQPQSAGNTNGWPSYPYPPYRNPYYDGGTPGNVLSGVIDWMLEFPSSAWDRFSEYLDSKFFPSSPATYGGGPKVVPMKPEGANQQPPSLPPANSYKTESR